MYGQVFASATGKWILLRTGWSIVNTDDVKALIKFLRFLVTDYLKIETFCDHMLTPFRPGKLTSSYSLYFMVVELWLTRACSLTLKKNAQYNLGFACFFLE